MPNGIPVATVALNAAQNAGILAAKIIATSNTQLQKRIIDFKTSLSDKVLSTVDEVEKHSNL
jgi:5-(carboxyamino)imidazole ribonucleotide mutase